MNTKLGAECDKQLATVVGMLTTVGDDGSIMAASWPSRCSCSYLLSQSFTVDSTCDGPTGKFFHIKSLSKVTEGSTQSPTAL